jgi:hypothetical protein
MRGNKMSRQFALYAWKDKETRKLMEKSGRTFKECWKEIEMEYKTRSRNGGGENIIREGGLYLKAMADSILGE